MKIGILTQPLGSNYGGILQNFALQQTLLSMGHEPVTIYYGHNTITDWILLWIRYIAKNILRHPNRKIKPPRYREFVLRSKTPNLVNFVLQRISLTSPMNGIDSSLVKSYGFEGYVVGSDQTWRPCYNGGALLYNMFLDFTGEENSVKRVAYAASFGVDNWEYSYEQQKRCKELVSRFDAVSVREISGVSLCQKYFGVEAQHLLDPTMLHGAEFYRAVCGSNGKVNDKVVALYILDMDCEKQQLIDGFCKANGMIPRYIGRRNSDGCYPSVESWLEAFDSAACVITDSFHGSAFAIIFNKPFIAIGNKARGMERFNSLFSILGLRGALVESTARPLACATQDWEAVNARLGEWREKSIKYLKEGLV